MRALVLGLCLLVIASGAQAASYLRTDGVVVDPIQYSSPYHDVPPYSGPNLEPNADLTGAILPAAILIGADLRGALLQLGYLPDANLTNADLSYADLSGAAVFAADLTGANLSNADLTGTILAVSDLSGADLTNAKLHGADLLAANLINADLTGANLSNANLTQAFYLDHITGSPFYNAGTDFTNAYSGYIAASPPFDPVAAGWTLVPEPNTALLLTLGLAGLGMRRRGH